MSVKDITVSEAVDEVGSTDPTPAAVEAAEKTSKIKFVSDEYKAVTLPTLRAWLRYWEGVQGGTRKVTPDSKDTVEMAPAEITKLQAEIDGRSTKTETA